MWKQLLHRIYNERKQNTWLYIELLIVLAIFWTTFNELFKSYQLSTLPTGTDIENCWRLHLDRSISSTDTEVDFTHDYDAISQIMENLRTDKSIEAIGLTTSSMPYSSANSYSDIYLTSDSLDKTKRSINALARYYTKDMMRVFRCKDIHGVPLANQIPDDDKIYVIPTKRTAIQLAGHTNLVDTLVSGMSNTGVRVLQIAQDIRYTDYSYISNCYYRTITREELANVVNTRGATQFSIQLCVRMKHAMTQQQMEEWLNNKKALIESPPLYVNSATSFKDIRKSMISYKEQGFKQHLFLISFLLVCAFLGILGTFWLRTAQRRQEIGLRMAMGGSKKSIILHFMCEGLLILLCTLPLIALFIGYYIATGHSANYEETILPTIITFLFSVLIMNLLIISGVLISAWSTFKIQAAEVLHDE